MKNASWIVSCKLMQSFLSFLIGMITARYLGPSNYGIINYAASLVAFVTPLMQLGFNETLVQEFIKKPEDSGKILGTSMVLNIIAGIASVIGLWVFSVATSAGDRETILVCILYSLTLVSRAAEMTMYWFQAELLSKYTSVTSLVAHFIGVVYKAYLLVSGKSVVWFALTHTIEACIISVILLLLFKKYCGQKLYFSFGLGKEMFSRSKHYISSGLMVVLFQQTDTIMLKFMTGAAEVGYYSSSITCMAVTGFVFAAIIDSARPWVLEGKKVSDDIFADRLKAASAIVLFVSLSQSVVMAIFAKTIVAFLFGQAYMPAANVLRIAVWYISFGYMGTIRNIWILANDKQKYLPVINFSGALLNVVVNFLLIPQFGATGAATASLITQFFTNVLLCFVLKPIRESGVIMIKSADPRILVNMVKKLLASGSR